MSRTGLLRAEQALADLTIDELRQHVTRASDVLFARTQAERIQAERSDADELETRNTQPAPPLAWDEGTR